MSAPNSDQYLPPNYLSPFNSSIPLDPVAYGFQSTGMDYTAGNKYSVAKTSFNTTFSKPENNRQFSYGNQCPVGPFVDQVIPAAMQTEMPAGVPGDSEMLYDDMQHYTNKLFQDLSRTEPAQYAVGHERDIQVPSSSHPKKTRRITLSKDELGEEERFLLDIAAKKYPWKAITTSYNNRFTKNATEDSLQMLVKRIREETKEWSDHDFRCLQEEKCKRPNADWKEIAKTVSTKIGGKVSGRCCRIKWDMEVGYSLNK